MNEFAGKTIEQLEDLQLSLSAYRYIAIDSFTMMKKYLVLIENCKNYARNL